MRNAALRAFCYKVFLMIEGDDVVEDVISRMQKWGYVDKDGFWKEEGEESDDPEDWGSIYEAKL